MGRMYLAKDRGKWLAVVNLRVSLSAGNLLTSCATVNFSRRTVVQVVTMKTARVC